MDKSKTKYRMWRTLELLLTSFGMSLWVPLMVFVLVMMGFITALDFMFYKAHLQYNVRQSFENSWIRATIDAATQLILDAMQAMMDRCHTKSLRPRVAIQAPVNYPQNVPLVFNTCTTQMTSKFFTELPREVRDEVYFWYFLLDGPGIRINIVQRPEGRHLLPILHAVPFSFGNNLPEICGTCDINGHKRACHALDPVKLPKKNCGRGRLAMLKTCKLAFTEMIQSLYSVPIFCFDRPTLQPYFLRNVSSHHLSNITHIALAYDEYTAAKDTFSGIHIPEHCARCNLASWLLLMKRFLTGVRKIDVFIYLVFFHRRRAQHLVYHVKQPWWQRIMALQHRDQRLRELQPHVHFREGEIEVGNALRLDLETEFREAIARDKVSRESLRQISTLCRRRAANEDPEA